MATKSKKIYRKKEDRSLELVGYLPTEDVSSRVDNIKSALAKKQDKLTPGKGISINTTTNEISVNDGAFATTDYVMNNFVANSIYEQDKDGLDHDIYGLASRVTANESSINNLNNAVSDRYTKAETDGKLDEKLSIITSSPKYWFDGSGEYRFCKIATITAKNSWVNRPIIFECIGRGMDSEQIISIYPSGSPVATGTAFTKITKTTNDLVWALKDEGNGVGSLYVMLSEAWGSVQVLRVSYDGVYVNVEMKMEPCDGFPEGSILAKNVITALLADTATTADTATNIKYIPGTRFTVNKFVESLTKNLFGEDTSYSGHARITTVRADYEAGVPDGIGILGDCGTGLAWYSTIDTGGLLSTSLGDYHFGKSATIGNIRGNGLEWWRYLVLSENGSNIADQSVAYADRAGYANSSGTAAVCESTTLLAAEGENLGAKIRSQYATGALGGGLTYHQATWYVVGNDGDTYNFSKMITTDNFGTNLTEALKNIKVEHTTRSDYATHLDYRNDDSTSISISYDNDNGTSLKYTSYPKLFINGITGYGVLEGNVYNHGTFQLAVSDNSNGTIYIRNVAKDGSAPSWAKLLIDDDAINSLDSDIINRPLSAYQGKVLNGKIASLSSKIDSLQNLPSWVTDDGFQNSANMYLTNFFAGTFSKKTSFSAGEDYMLDISITAASFGRGKWYATASPCGVNGSTGDWSTQFTVTCSILNESTIRVWFHCLNGSNSSSSTKLYCNVVAIKYW